MNSPADRLRDRAVVVIGGGGSLAGATVRRLAGEGAHLFLVGRDHAKLEAVRDEAVALGACCSYATGDITDAEAWDGIVASAREEFDEIHGMVNFAAVLSRANLTDTDVDTWNTVLGTNLSGAWLAMRAIIPEIARSGGGSVVNVGSIDALVGRGASTAYAASKGGLRATTKSAAVGFAADGVRVNSVHPAPMETRVEHMIGPSDPSLDVEGLLAELIADIPLGRLGAADDVAAAVAFLLSDDAAYITGVDLPVDGGYTAH